MNPNTLIEIELPGPLLRTLHIELVETADSRNPKYFLSCAAEFNSGDSIEKDLCQVPIANSLVNDILKKISEAKIVLNPKEKMMGLDGRSYRIRFRDHFDGQEFYWWMKAPPEWSLLAEIVSQIDALAVKDKTPPIFL